MPYAAAQPLQARAVFPLPGLLSFIGLAMFGAKRFQAINNILVCYHNNSLRGFKVFGGRGLTGRSTGPYTACQVLG